MTLKSSIATGLKQLAESMDLGASMLLDWSASPSAFRRAYVTGRLSGDEWERLWKNRTTYQSRRRLEAKGWLKTRRQGDAVVVRLHKDAAVAILRDRIKRGNARLSKNQICLVVFDIPESAADARRAWRRFLKEARFGQVQRSAWACDRDVGDDMKALIRLLKIEPWACVYIARRV